MATSIIWSPEAIEDVEAIASYIERDSPWYAAAVVSRLIETTEEIRFHPSLGRVVPEVKSPTLRERFVYSYRLIYDIRPDDILIVAIVHGRRLLEPVIETRR